MKDDIKTRIRIFCGVGLGTMFLLVILTDSKPAFGWIRIIYMALLALGLLSTFVFRTHKESK